MSDYSIRHRTDISFFFNVNIEKKNPCSIDSYARFPINIFAFLAFLFHAIVIEVSSLVVKIQIRPLTIQLNHSVCVIVIFIGLVVTEDLAELIQDKFLFKHCQRIDCGNLLFKNYASQNACFLVLDTLLSINFYFQVISMIIGNTNWFIIAFPNTVSALPTIEQIFIDYAFHFGQMRVFLLETKNSNLFSCTRLVCDSDEYPKERVTQTQKQVA
jgi:hypothetical protein